MGDNIFETQVHHAFMTLSTTIIHLFVSQNLHFASVLDTFNRFLIDLIMSYKTISLLPSICGVKTCQVLLLSVLSSAYEAA